MKIMKKPKIKNKPFLKKVPRIDPSIETLVSLRIMGAVRIWGIRVHNCFKVLWWDPEHKIFPSKLKHT